MMVVRAMPVFVAAVLMLVMMMIVAVIVMMLVSTMLMAVRAVLVFVMMLQQLALVTVHMMVRGRVGRRSGGSQHVELRCVDLAADNRARAEPYGAGIETHARQPFFNNTKRHARIEQRPNGHVAADTGKAIEVRNLHTSGDQNK
jgi:hypothetical protein